MFVSVAILLTFVNQIAALATDAVTCGSVIKLKHKDSVIYFIVYFIALQGFHLHSHAIAWGSGSGQQSITANDAQADGNSLWLIKEAHRAPGCSVGTEINCGDKIRLEHVQTKHNLHSHLFTSPVSKQQEVSGFGENGDGDTGDSWEVVCQGREKYWERGSVIQLKHVDTGKFLFTSSSNKFDQKNCGGNCPIMGQLEVSASAKKADSKTWWQTGQGVYFPSANEAARKADVDNELQ